MESCTRAALSVPTVLLPAENIDLARWAVIACDQFTSEPEYWEQVSRFVGDSPSTLNMIFPEVFLGQAGEEARITAIREAMRSYLAQGVFREVEGLIYVERQAGRFKRRGLLACLDLEAYDYTPGSTSLIRASEGTILERLPPRIKIREGAPLELPHIMVLFDDPEDSVLGPLTARRKDLEKLYDFELMMNSGRLEGFRVGNRSLEKSVIPALENLAAEDRFRARYGLPAETPVLLFAMGDGNHSLATAKAIWEKAKSLSPDNIRTESSPLRYALAELVNLHDPAMVFEPIHRVVFGLGPGRGLMEEWADSRPSGDVFFRRLSSLEEMKGLVNGQNGRPHKIGLIREEGFGLAEIGKPDFNLPVGTLQAFLDLFLKDRGARGVDYVHGDESLAELGRRPGNLGFYLPAMAKHDLFRTIILDGVLPRKTFSMGEAREKRFYMEARRISEQEEA
ncbi:MAG: hypothetical protein A2Y56_08940 [Candidatus Aminicenantes bacterium RBG_13_63_10]|nr:MAG: hypothetical protein A2Y56_08940 [Candidatus Aminicenantes bacterium RBG_13_63_10]